MISLFVIFKVWGCVGHKKVVNFCCSDIFKKFGTIDAISSNAVSNLVHLVTKCCSSSTGAVDGPEGDDALVCGGEHGVLVSGGEQGVLVLGGEQ